MYNRKAIFDMQKHISRFVVAGVLIVIACVALFFVGSAPKSETAVLGGRVTWTVERGETVKEGDALVRISSLVGGEAVAARASVEGTVAEVCVAPGVAIKSGDVVVKINRN